MQTASEIVQYLFCRYDFSRVTNTYHITIYRDTDEDWRYVACAFEFEQGIGFNFLIVVIDTCNQVLFVLFRFFKLNK